MGCWLHRISHEWEKMKELLDSGLLSTGWRCFADSGITAGIDSAEFDEIMGRSGETRRSRWALWYFAQMRPGDMVVVPLYGESMQICEVTGVMRRAKEAEAEDYDIGFVIPVKCLAELPRSWASAAIQSRLKYRGTTARMDELECDIEAALEAEGPVMIHDRVIDGLYGDLKEILLKWVTPDKLERIVKWYMRSLGASYVYIPAKNASDKPEGGDADVIAEFATLRVRFYIQVKKHEDMSGKKAVEQIAAYTQAIDEDGYTLIFWAISTAEFGDDASELARVKNVRLIGGQELCRMLLDAGIGSIDEAMIS